MEFTIKRSEWQRGKVSREGHRNLPTFLLRKSDGKKCCLGFYGLACGYEPSDIEEVTTPARLVNAPAAAELKDGFQSLVDVYATYDRMAGSFHNSLLAERLMNVNDNREITEQEREDEVRNLFAEVGVTVKFED